MPKYVTVRRPVDAPFRVLTDDLVAEKPDGYDLELMRSLAADGLANSLSVRPIAGGRFEVVDGRKRLAVIRMLVRLDKMVFDKVRGLLRPAKKVFALLRCRIRDRPASTIPGREDTPEAGLVDG